jgi:hypothetical protein
MPYSQSDQALTRAGSTVAAVARTAAMSANSWALSTTTIRQQAPATISQKGWRTLRTTPTNSPTAAAGDGGGDEEELAVGEDGVEVAGLGAHLARGPGKDEGNEGEQDAEDEPAREAVERGGAGGGVERERRGHCAPEAMAVGGGRTARRMSPRVMGPRR